MNLTSAMQKPKTSNTTLKGKYSNAASIEWSVSVYSLSTVCPWKLDQNLSCGNRDLSWDAIRTSSFRVLSDYTRSCQKLSNHTTSTYEEYWILQSVKQEIKSARSLSHCTKLFTGQFYQDLLSKTGKQASGPYSRPSLGPQPWPNSLSSSPFSSSQCSKHKAKWGLWQWMEGRDNCIRIEKSWTKRCIYILPLHSEPLSFVPPQGQRINCPLTACCYVITPGLHSISETIRWNCTAFAKSPDYVIFCF